MRGWPKYQTVTVPVPAKPLFEYGHEWLYEGDDLAAASTAAMEYDGPDIARIYRVNGDGTGTIVQDYQDGRPIMGYIYP